MVGTRVRDGAQLALALSDSPCPHCGAAIEIGDVFGYVHVATSYSRACLDCVWKRWNATEKEGR
jgi:hypothetical protein